MRRLQQSLRRRSARRCPPSIFIPYRLLTTSYVSYKPASQTAQEIEDASSPALLLKTVPVHIPARATSNDSAVKAHFDLPHSIFGDMAGVRSEHAKGLFLYAPLTQSDSLRRLTDRTLIQASAIVQRIVVAPQDPTGRELRLVVKNLDRLSDILCAVIDMCELVRNVHPDQDWVDQSDRTHQILCSFMNELNATRGLYEVSPRVTSVNQHADYLTHFSVTCKSDYPSFQQPIDYFRA